VVQNPFEKMVFIATTHENETRIDENKFGKKKDIISRCRSFTTSFVFWVINLECAS